MLTPDSRAGARTGCSRVSDSLTVDTLVDRGATTPSERVRRICESRQLHPGGYSVPYDRG